MKSTTKTPAATTRAATTPAATTPAANKTAAKTPAGKTPTVKKAAAKTPTAKKTAANKTAAKTSPKKAPSAKAPATTTAKPRAGGTREAARPAQLAVRPGEDPWTSAELAEVRVELELGRDRLHAEIAHAEDDIAGLLRDSGDGAGDDQADTGTKTFEREHEMSLANNSRGLLTQVDHALVRIEDGSYGVCESCGNPIGKARLQAFPRATLCLTCKSREERR